MSEPRFVVERLGRHHNRAAFSCGVDALDHYLRHQASQDVRRNAAVTYVLSDTTSSLIAGYYTLSAMSVVANRLPPTLTKKLTRYAEQPAMLIGRLAVDSRYQGQGIGQRLLLDALRRVLELSSHFGVVIVIVDAQNAAARSFYQRYGFEPIIDDEDRLFLPMQRITQL